MHIRPKIAWTIWSLLAASNAVGQVSLLVPAETGQTATRSSQISSDPHAGARRLVALNPAAIDKLRAGDETDLIAPNGATYRLIYDRTEVAYGGGSVWVGHLRDHGQDFPALISTYAGQVNGNISTPTGKLRLEGEERHAVLTDIEAADEQLLIPSLDDTMRAKVGRSTNRNEPNSTPTAPSVANAASGSPAQIDLLILFTGQMQTQLGGYAATIARLNLLVATANNVYANSQIYVSLNLVYAQAISYSYSDKAVSDDTALNSMQSDSAVAALRNQYGADVVVMVRPFQASVCGLGFQTLNFSYSDYAFAVVEDGSNGGYYCDVTTLTHEVGHVMGAAHDVATSLQSAAQSGQNCNADPNYPCTDGTPSYNRGYCNGNAGTIMSYPIAANGCAPLSPYFSNPNLNTCNSGSCGVPIGTSYTVGSTTVTGADSATAINANAPAMATWRGRPTKFTALTPSRILDTRPGMQTSDGTFAGNGAMGANTQLDLSVAGRGGVPSIGAGAVVMNVTITNPNAIGYVTAWPTGSARPNASNINFVPGQTIPNLVVAKLGNNGKVSLFNAGNTTDLIADVAGWFPTGSAFVPLVPARLLDTRTTGSRAPVTGGTELDVAVAGHGGVPASGADTVVFNLTVTQPVNFGHVTVWPAGGAQPNASSINFVQGQTIANLVISKIGANGSVALSPSATTHIVADVAGWFPAGSELTAITPARLLDTRPGMSTVDGQFAGGGSIGPASQIPLKVTGRAGIPSSGVGAVVLNVIAVQPTALSFLTIWPTGSTQPNASNLNFVAGDIVANLVVAKVGANGQVSIYNQAGTTNVVADVVGWFAPSP